MNPVTIIKTKDYQYSEYIERQKIAISNLNINQQVIRLKCSDKFVIENNVFSIKPYCGYAVSSMVKGNSHNDKLLSNLENLSNILDRELNADSKTFFMLNSDSFHQTIANTLSAQRYIDNIVEKGLEASYPRIIGDAFSQIELPKRQEPIKMKMTGLNVFGSCIVILGVFEKEQDFTDLMLFRELESYATSQYLS